MVAKLLACRAALRDGVNEVAIINGRNPRQGLFDRTVSATVVTR
jgi:acetylglutamate kinase